MKTETLAGRSIAGIVRGGVMAAAIATIGNTVIYLLSSIFNVSFTVPTPSEPFTITIINVITETLLLAASATLVFALLCRLTTRAGWIFRLIAGLVLVVSFVFPLMLSVEPPLKIVLMLMHIFSATVIVAFLTRSQLRLPQNG